MYKDIFKKTWKIWFWFESLGFSQSINNPGNSFSYLPYRMSLIADLLQDLFLRYFKKSNLLIQT